MSELAETPRATRCYCPGCDPSADPIRELIEINWCTDHRPDANGIDDRLVATGGRYLLGASEVHGDDCRAYAELLHRKARRA